LSCCCGLIRGMAGLLELIMRVYEGYGGAFDGIS
jgi:hypothetical protein